MNSFTYDEVTNNKLSLIDNCSLDIALIGDDWKVFWYEMNRDFAEEHDEFKRLSLIQDILLN